MPVTSLAESAPIDVVITWVDGSDSNFHEKLESHLNGKSRNAVPGANLTRFASVNEITYCVLSVLTFAPFVRKIFIVTDNQNPKIFDVVKKFFPERLKSISIVDHTEIFNGYEEFLPTFNSRSIETMIWRIKGLSNNFIYFNDDNFLVRPIEPNDWFINSKPLLRGKWSIAPTPRLFWSWAKLCLKRFVLRKTHYEPRPSFHIGQWNAARIAGYTFKYFANGHTPHSVDLLTISTFLKQNEELLKKNIRYKFRSQKQFNVISLSNHLQLNKGNRHIAKPDLAYIQPVGRAKGYIDKKIAYCQKNKNVKYLCVQSLDLCSQTDRDKLYSWMDSILQLRVDTETWLQSTPSVYSQKPQSQLAENITSPAIPSIDLVYLWVDGSDKNWQKKKNAAIKRDGKELPISSVRSTRWANHNELLYSLRSVEKFAPWINHIFIVTDGHKPEWLDTNNPKVSIVDHKEIIPHEKLPLFNSNAIEMFLWKIPNLSEHFLYACDDMFFGKEVKPDFFFDENGNPIVIMKQRSRSFANLDDQSEVKRRLFSIKTARTIKFVYKQLGIKYNLSFKHAIEPIRKSYMAGNFNTLKQHLMETTITPFRHVNNLQRIVMPLYDNACERNTIVFNWRTNSKRITYNYRKDTLPKRIQNSALWIIATIFVFIHYDCIDKQMNLISNIRKHKPTLFTINDFSDKESSFKQASEFIKSMFPTKSAFEK